MKYVLGKDNSMRKKIWRGAALGVFTACAALYACSVSYAVSDGMDRNILEEMLRISKEQESKITGKEPEYISDTRFLAEDRTQNDIRVMSMAKQCMETGKEQVFYMVGKNFAPEGSILPTLFGSGIEYSSTSDCQGEWEGDSYELVRFAVKPAESEERSEEPVLSEDEKGYWNLGDVVAQKIGETTYHFRCIDQNYQGMALFLCTSVIPANTGSGYEYGLLEDGTHGYMFRPGPIVNFGDSSEYKESRLRGWLKEQEGQLLTSPSVNVGVTKGYRGRTESGTYDQFDSAAIEAYNLGSQHLMDKLFIFSLDEALRYREYLWDAEVPSNSAFARGYWLRSPMSSADQEESGYVYVVDLEDGSIHPCAVKPELEEDEKNSEAKNVSGVEAAQLQELAVTSSIGLRPAFLLPQRD